MRKENQK